MMRFFTFIYLRFFILSDIFFIIHNFALLRILPLNFANLAPLSAIATVDEKSL